jgi:hypothetical protein
VELVDILLALRCFKAYFSEIQQKSALLKLQSSHNSDFSCNIAEKKEIIIIITFSFTLISTERRRLFFHETWETWKSCWKWKQAVNKIRVFFLASSCEKNEQKKINYMEKRRWWERCDGWQQQQKYNMENVLGWMGGWQKRGGMVFCIIMMLCCAVHSRNKGEFVEVLMLLEI